MIRALVSPLTLSDHLKAANENRPPNERITDRDSEAGYRRTTSHETVYIDRYRTKRTDEILGVLLLCAISIGLGFAAFADTLQLKNFLGSKRGRSPVLRAGWSEPDLSLSGRRISDFRVRLHTVSASRAAAAATGYGPSVNNSSCPHG